jgi:hypothetical protein
MLKRCAVIPQSSNMSRVTDARDKGFSIVFLSLQANAGILKQDVVMSWQIPNCSLVVSCHPIQSQIIKLEVVSLNDPVRNILPTSGLDRGTRGSVVEAQFYKPEGRGFDSR